MSFESAQRLYDMQSDDRDDYDISDEEIDDQEQAAREEVEQKEVDDIFTLWEEVLGN